jgi:DNA-directed RNA polymerase subunit RPC12/RpoP
MSDIFDSIILCKKCGKKMQKLESEKNGFRIRFVVCPKCGEKILHPVDELEYQRFKSLKDKEFRVKMRLVGNSYAVSIPKEIVSFMEHQEKIMDEMVRLCFEDFGRVSLNFGEKGVQNA